MNKLGGGLEAFSILLTVMNDSRNIRMMNLRGGARFHEKSRTCIGIFGQPPTDDFEGDSGV